MHGQIEITHMPVDGSFSTVITMKLLDEAYQQSFDAVYSIRGYQFISFGVESEIDIPEENGGFSEKFFCHKMKKSVLFCLSSKRSTTARLTLMLLPWTLMLSLRGAVLG
jgi:hypothetical protein